MGDVPDEGEDMRIAFRDPSKAPSEDMLFPGICATKERADMMNPNTSDLHENESSKNGKRDYLLGIVYILFGLTVFFAGYTLRGRNQDFSVSVPLPALKTPEIGGIVDITDAAMIKTLLDRYLTLSGQTASIWEKEHGKMTPEQVTAYVWLIQNVISHPCPLADKFILTQSQLALKAALNMTVAKRSP